MNPITITVIVCATIAAATLVLLFIVIPRTWGHFWAAIDNRVDTMHREALNDLYPNGRNRRPHHDIDAEYRQLVAAEQARD